MLIIGPLGLLFVIVVFVVIAFVQNKSNNDRLDFEAEKAKWERANGRPYPFSDAELVLLQKAHAKKKAKKSLIEMAVAIVCIIAGVLTLLHGIENNSAFIATLGLILPTVGFLILLKGLLFRGKSPTIRDLMKELEETQS